ncbi:hypothetical protein IAR55_001877 [Kwoniella newhampshirensis]|uniref:Uncharacterized protein n=1 Tax=Kwoniella newhampshirensis TaxID=1651941 RepID=A0AAW0Z3D9_9TREE
MLDDIPGLSKFSDSQCLTTWLVLVVGATCAILSSAVLAFVILTIRETVLIHNSKKHHAVEESEHEKLVEIAEDVGVDHTKSE